MWKIFEKKGLVKVLQKLPVDVLEKYEIWKRIIEMEGLLGLRNIKGFHDEALKGAWKGFRSSRLGIKWRVIYTVDKEILSVYVIEINPHTY